jgi:hypothetical protein
MKSKVTTHPYDLHDGSMKLSVDIDPTMASCYGPQRSTLNKHQPRRRLWLRKKSSDSKQILEKQSNDQHIVDALLNSLVTIDRSSATSSASGSLSNENSTTKSNVNAYDSSHESNTPSLEYSEGNVGEQHETSKAVPTKSTSSVIQESSHAPVSDKLYVPTKSAVEYRHFPVNACTNIPLKMYQVVDLDCMHNNASRDIPDDRSVHSLDTISTVTMDPVLKSYRLSKEDDFLKKSATNSSSYRRQQNYHRVKGLPLLQTFGNPSFACDLSMWTNTAVGHECPREHNACERKEKFSVSDQNPGALAGKVLSYITTSDSVVTTGSARDMEKAPLIINTSPKKSLSTIDEKKIRKYNRRKLRSYQYEPSLSPVADAHLIEI